MAGKPVSIGTRDRRVACGTIRIGMAGKNMARRLPSSGGSARAARSMSVRLGEGLVPDFIAKAKNGLTREWCRKAYDYAAQAVP